MFKSTVRMLYTMDEWAKTKKDEEEQENVASANKDRTIHFKVGDSTIIAVTVDGEEVSLVNDNVVYSL